MQEAPSISEPMNMPRNERSRMKYIFFGLCVMCVTCLGAISQEAPGTRAPDIGDARARFEQERLRRVKGEPQKTPAPQAPASKTAAPAPKPSTPPKPPADTNEDFIIGPEDVLEITVWREPELMTKAVVRPDGKIGVTLLGDVQASGLTTTQLKAQV